MSNSSNYPDYIEWLQAVRVSDSGGSRPKSYNSNGHLWGGIDEQSGREQDMMGNLRNVITATIKLRNFPAVAPEDRLLYVQYNRLFTIIGIYYGVNETICDCEARQGIDD